MAQKLKSTKTDLESINKDIQQDRQTDEQTWNLYFQDCQKVAEIGCLSPNSRHFSRTTKYVRYFRLISGTKLFVPSGQRNENKNDHKMQLKFSLVLKHSLKNSFLKVRVNFAGILMSTSPYFFNSPILSILFRAFRTIENSPALLSQAH